MDKMQISVQPSVPLTTLNKYLRNSWRCSFLKTERILLVVQLPQLPPMEVLRCVKALWGLTCIIYNYYSLTSCVMLRWNWFKTTTVPPSCLHVYVIAVHNFRIGKSNIHHSFLLQRLLCYLKVVILDDSILQQRQYTFPKTVCSTFVQYHFY